MSNIISRAEGTNFSYDLYISNLSSLIKIESEIKKSKLFSNIYYYKQIVTKKNTIFATLLSHINTILGWIFRVTWLKKHDLSQIAHSYTDYDIIMSSGWISYFVKLIKVNPSSKVYMFEDGTGTYFGDERSCWESILPLPRSKLFFYKFLNKFFRTGPFSIPVQRVYINKREMLLANFPV